MSQIRKLFYNKQFVDKGGGQTIAEWKIAPWKVFAFFISLAVAMILIYAFFFTKDTQNFLGNVLFYSIVLVLSIAAIWLVGNKAISMKQRLTYFIIAFILIWLMYWVFSVIFGYTGLMKFYMGGYILWVIISIMAFMGAKRIDNHLDRNDVLFSLLVLAVFIGANIPMTSTATSDTFTLENISSFTEIDHQPAMVTYGDIPSQHYASVVCRVNNVTETVTIGFDAVQNQTATRTFTYSESRSAGFLENIDGIITKMLSVVKI